MRRIHPQPEYDGDLWRYKGRFYTTPDLAGELTEIAPEGETPVIWTEDGNWYWVKNDGKTSNDSSETTGKEPECGQG